MSEAPTRKRAARSNAKTPTHTATAPMDELRGAQIYIERTRTLVYALRYPDGLHYVTSDRRILTEEYAKREYIVTSVPSRRTRFSWKAAVAFQRDGTAPNAGELFARLTALFREHVYWASPHTPVLLAVWVMATYAFRVFTYFPYIALHSANKRSGKSLVQELISETAYNATSPMLGATPAPIFRDIHANDGTQILDEVETLRDIDKGNKSQMLAVLCGGFKRGSTVPRCEPGKNGVYTTPTEYAVFSPKVLAGINETADVIRDRSLTVRMVRKPADVTCKRFNVVALTPHLQRLRDDLHVFGLAHVNDILDAYTQPAASVLVPKLDDRGRDICEPLFAVAHVVGEEAERALAVAVREIARQRREDDASTEGELDAARMVLLGVVKDHGDPFVLRTDGALEYFRLAGLSAMERDEDARSMLRRLGLRSASHRNEENKVVRGYRITRAQLAQGSDASV